MSKTHYDITEGDLERELIGKRIVNIDEDANTLTLDDGTHLIFEDTSSCCAWFRGQLHAGNLTDNAITNVWQEWTGEGEYAEAWVLHILAGENRIASVDIEGNSASGYYCHSINLRVVHKGED